MNNSNKLKTKIETVNKKNKNKNVSCYDFRETINEINTVKKSGDMKLNENITINNKNKSKNLTINETLNSIDQDNLKNENRRVNKGNSFVTKLSKTVKMSKTDLPKVVFKDEKKASFVNTNNYKYKPADDNKNNLFKKYSNNQIKGLFKHSPIKNKESSKIKDKDMSKEQSTSLFNSFLSKNSSAIAKEEENNFSSNFKNLFSKFNELCENLKSYKIENEEIFDENLFKKETSNKENDKNINFGKDENCEYVQKNYKLTSIIDNIQLEANKFNLTNLRSSKIIQNQDNLSTIHRNSDEITNLSIEENYIHNSSINRINNYKQLLKLISNNYKSFEDVFKTYINSKKLGTNSINQTNNYSVNFNFNFSSLNNTSEVKYISKENNFSLIKENNYQTVSSMHNLNNLKVFKNSSFVIGELNDLNSSLNKEKSDLFKKENFQNSNDIEINKELVVDNCININDIQKLTINIKNDNLNKNLNDRDITNKKIDSTNILNDKKIILNEDNYFSSGYEDENEESELKSNSKSEYISESNDECEENSFSDSSIDENVPQVALPNLKSSKKMGFKLVNNAQNTDLNKINLSNLKSKKSKSNINSKNMLSTRRKKKEDLIIKENDNINEDLNNANKCMYFKEELIHNDQKVFAEYYLEEKFTTRTKMNQTKKSHFVSGKTKPVIITDENNLEI